jgi:hypothetical protein
MPTISISSQNTLIGTAPNFSINGATLTESRLGKNILQRNGYAISAKAALYFVVYSCVAASFTCMAKTSDFPVLHVSTYYLRIARQSIEGNFRLRDVGIAMVAYEQKLQVQDLPCPMDKQYFQYGFCEDYLSEHQSSKKH